MKILLYKLKHLPSRECSTGPTPHVGSFRRAGPGGVGAGELVLSLAWAGQENWQADQDSYHPGPHPRL